MALAEKSVACYRRPQRGRPGDSTEWKGRSPWIFDDRNPQCVESASLRRAPGIRLPRSSMRCQVEGVLLRTCPLFSEIPEQNTFHYFPTSLTSSFGSLSLLRAWSYARGDSDFSCEETSSQRVVPRLCSFGLLRVGRVEGWKILAAWFFQGDALFMLHLSQQVYKSTQKTLGHVQQKPFVKLLIKISTCKHFIEEAQISLVPSDLIYLGGSKN